MRQATLRALLGVVLIAGPLAANSATVYFGTDVDGSTTQSDAAYASWRAGVSGEVSDNLDGLAGTGGPNANLTSSVGNNFTTTNEAAYGLIIGPIGVISGAHLEFSNATPGGSFTWSLQSPSNAFGFFVFDLDGADIVIEFTDGTVQQFTATSVTGDNNSSFWGIRGLNSLIASVTIGSSIAQTSYWDRFSYGTTSVPEPGSLLLLVAGLAGLASSRRRQTH